MADNNDNKKIVIEFRPFVGVRPSGGQKPYRIPQLKLISDFVEDLARENGGKRFIEVPIPAYDDYGNIAFYRPEKEQVEQVDRTVLLGRVFVDYANGRVIADGDLKLWNGVKLQELYSVKKKARIKRVAKVEGEKVLETVSNGEKWEFEYIGGDRNNPVSFKDAYSYKCAFCDKVYGYQHAAKWCSVTHVARGLIEGDLFSAGVKGVMELGAEGAAP